MKNGLFHSIINPAVIEMHRPKEAEGFDLGRIVSEHRDRYKVICGSGMMQGELLGNLRFTAESRKDLPAVGDWVAITPYDDDKALIHFIYPRSNTLERQTVGKETEKQIIATNIDGALIVTSCGRDFNLNRIERYLTICNAAKVEVFIVLTKTDLVDSAMIEDHISDLHNLNTNLNVFPVDNLLKTGIDALSKQIVHGKSYCLMGSSGVGKSTLINSLMDEERMDTGNISSSVNKGRHTTTHRELIVLPSGGIIIDNPGMREVGITESGLGLELTFDKIHELAQKCKYADCTHIHEKKCAVLEGLENREIDERTYENYLKMLKEKNHFDTSLMDKKRYEKKFGKLMKEVKKVRKARKY
jgi:ribosome biogenesis GTPase